MPLRIAERLTEGGRLIGIDQDMDAIRAASKHLSVYRDRVELVHDNYEDIASILQVSCDYLLKDEIEEDTISTAFAPGKLLSSLLNKKVKLNFFDDEGDIELIGAEETAREILKIAQTMPEGSKERGEMFVRYADLIRKNDTQTPEDDDPVRIYLPMKCSICPLKQEFDLKNNQKDEENAK